MRMKRLAGGVLSAALLGLTPVAFTAGPAQAATPTATTITGKLTGTIKGSTARYKANVSISGNVESANGYPTGTLVIQQKLAGKKSYKTVYTDTSPGYFSHSFKAKQNANYRIVFTGGSDSQYTYLNSETSANLKVMRDLGDKISNLKLQGKVKPKYKKKKVTIEIKTSKKGKWKKWATVKTNKKGKWAKKLPARAKCTYWRAWTKKDKKFVKSYSTYSYYTVRGYKSCS